MGMRFAGLLLLSLIVVSVRTAAALPRPFEVTTDIFGGEQSGEELLLFGFNPNVRYSLQLSDAPEDSPAFRAIDSAISQTRLLTLTVDWRAARLGPDRKHMVFPVCSVRFEEISAVMSAPCPRADERMPPGYTVLAQGVALSETGRLADSLPLLSKAIESGDLDEEWRLNALTFRAGNRFSHAFTFPDWSEAQDRLLVAALADLRRVEAERPSPKVKNEIANALSRLGAYEEAQDVVAGIDDPEDPEQFQKTITSASIARLQGKPQVALDMLNALSARMSSEGGMKFHYHRGRTLMQLGRMDEAVAEFTTGIANQPDYWSALVLRGCALAAVGDITRAKEDFQAAQSKIVAVVVDGPQSDTNKLLEKMISKMETSERTSRLAPDTEVCVDYVGKLDSKRTRSPFLP